MQRSGSQKALLVISVLTIIFAIIILIFALVALLGIGAAGTIDAGDAEVNTVLRSGGTAVFGIAYVFFLVLGCWELFCGILGVRAANDNQKIMIVWVFSLIGLAVAVLSLVIAIFNGEFGSNWISYILSLVWPALMFWLANNIKQEAGR